MIDVRYLPWKAALIALLLLAAFVYLFPKVRLHPLSPGITNNTWSYDIVYRSRDGSYVIHCDFMTHDSTPYWEGQNSWEDEHVCGDLPIYLHQGVPPMVVHVRIEGRAVELRAPLVWGRLI